jgi:hypothetical protein
MVAFTLEATFINSFLEVDALPINCFGKLDL